MRVINEGNIAWIDRASDERFRHLLIHGCPGPLQAKMRDALAIIPPANAQEEAKKHFGDELPLICAMVGTLIDTLDDAFRQQGHDGFVNWLNLTNYGNERHFIAVIADWAAHRTKTDPEKPNA